LPDFVASASPNDDGYACGIAAMRVSALQRLTQGVADQDNAGITRGARPSDELPYPDDNGSRLSSLKAVSPENRLNLNK
jgi:hypothetical protein